MIASAPFSIVLIFRGGLKRFGLAPAKDHRVHPRLDTPASFKSIDPRQQKRIVIGVVVPQVGLHSNADSLAQACTFPALAGDFCSEPCDRKLWAAGMLPPDVSAYCLNAVSRHAVLQSKWSLLTITDTRV